MSSKSTHTFEFLLFDGFSNMVLASAMEPLRDVKFRSIHGGVDWVTSTMDGGPVLSSSGLQITPDQKFDYGREGRKLVVIAGYQARKALTSETGRILRRSIRHSELILALDTAPWLLAETGVLDGHSATIHWQELDAFEEAFPKVTVSTSRFVRSGSFLTCGGASAALDTMLDLIHQLFGSAAAFDASTMFVYDAAIQNEMNRGAVRFREKGSPKVLAALNVMAENVETPLSTFDLADRVSLSERTLNRLFMRELGITPGKYYKLVRLQRARYLAEETLLSAEQIALRCGFSSASSLSRSFQNIFGLSMRSVRVPEQV
ncbi:HTH-type transcriptional regulator CdhR [Roseovarius albus]|uniref:HTH-type transcriptional regulator CdhR n=1 Tax=Roseovarius albus TaxID=1247867 RepID=A0A1X7A5X3_9RHOB|nr:helix-turn-helix domain-containing protein [Roseovarius albus]SLN71140.1 HTH-type transcriptional regulator CdhR [Roseovarius albus]